MKEENIKIGNCVYHMRKASFMDTRDQAFKLTALLKGCFTSSNKAGDNTSNKIDIDVGQFISNLGSKEMDEISDFLRMQTRVTDEDGKKVLLQNKQEFEEFFSEHQDQYLEFLFEGAKFHFLGFLPSGLASKINMPDLATMADLVT